ncbi:MAG: hypothetical protein AAGI34_15245 [Pseudomonadota bacterium]
MTDNRSFPASLALPPSTTHKAWMGGAASAISVFVALLLSQFTAVPSPDPEAVQQSLWWLLSAIPAFGSGFALTYLIPNQKKPD